MTDKWNMPERLREIWETIDPDNDYDTADKSKTWADTAFEAAREHGLLQTEGEVADAGREITRLRAENERLREVLAEITILIDKHDKQEADDE